MTDMTNEQERLRLDLAQLRAALHEIAPPPFDETAVRAAFRSAHRVPARAVTDGRRRYVRLQLAAAAAVALAVGAALGLALLVGNEPAVPQQVSVSASSQYIVPAFQPLQNAPSLMPSASYSVVRVRIPLSSLALVPGTEQGGTIEAELLVGEDGLARGIRFMQAEALLVSAQP
jgi:anti-sigma-K factor RskA